MASENPRASLAAQLEAIHKRGPARPMSDEVKDAAPENGDEDVQEEESPEEEEEEEEVYDPPEERKILKDYKSKDKDDLALKKNGTVVVEREKGGLAYGCVKGKPKVKAWFPSDCIEATKKEKKKKRTKVHGLLKKTITKDRASFPRRHKSQDEFAGGPDSPAPPSASAATIAAASPAPDKSAAAAASSAAASAQSPAGALPARSNSSAEISRTGSNKQRRPNKDGGGGGGGGGGGAAPAGRAPSLRQTGKSQSSALADAAAAEQDVIDGQSQQVQEKDYGTKEKRKNSLGAALMKRPKEKELLDKGILQKTTRAIPVFGVPLGQIMYTSYSEFDLPLVFVDCAKYLRADSKILKEEGIFRLSGGLDEINALKDAWNAGRDPDFSKATPHSVAGVLKLFFRELPEPLFTFRAYDHFIKSVTITADADRLQYTRDLLKALPPHCTKLIGALMKLLTEVAVHADVNKMSTQNLGIVFGPTVLRSRNELATMLVDSPKQCDIVDFLVRHYKELFDKLEDYKPRIRALSQAPPANGKIAKADPPAESAAADAPAASAGGDRPQTSNF